MKEILARLLKIALPKKQSAFLWGPRQTGKTTFLNATFPDSLRFDLLQTDLYLELVKRPFLLREQLLAAAPQQLEAPIIIDEVQKVPQLLDEIHWLIENKGLRFILCGSSARKLKRGRTNLLGGRAWRYEMHPLVSAEVAGFDLLRALNRGMVPSHYLQPEYRKSLRAYLHDYLKEEVFDEGLTRNFPAFSRFFDAVGYSHGELTNYANIARDCGVDSKTVKEYYQILMDTLLGTMIEPFKKRQDRQVITRTGKFYLFDVGVAGAITNRQIPQLRGELFGKALEHFILMELLAHRSYRELHYDVNFWRTKSGVEVDFILNGGEVAIEVKGTHRIDSAELRSMKAFIQDYRPARSFIVCTESAPRKHEGIFILPWQVFLEQLWTGDVV
ncbi:MAG TPA: AAA family ATPase [Acidobacteriota bacterium]|jgi:predicted AAA+ superfamily ATPase|nr:AAA family ATPase [Acidobacteriota bacterium]HNU00189.1 AAA family ATPase [Acidobacteriota bacterium]HPB29728.1 AAA family ATPase [Acidobacteriota bacterium]HQO26693.1 AAA family ATPase [Acidobacteriota bacterium]